MPHDKDLTIERLANEACPSPFHFARAFRAATGMTPPATSPTAASKDAKSWILKGSLPIAEIAHLCVTASQTYFTKWFKRLVGATPGEYRAGSR